MNRPTEPGWYWWRRETPDWQRQLLGQPSAYDEPVRVEVVIGNSRFGCNRLVARLPMGEGEEFDDVDVDDAYLMHDQWGDEP